MSKALKVWTINSKEIKGVKEAKVVKKVKEGKEAKEAKEGKEEIPLSRISTFVAVSNAQPASEQVKHSYFSSTNNY